MEQQHDGSRAEIDTTTGFRRYYYKNGKLQMTGKVTKATSKDYRDGLWSYYNEAGQLMTQETYTQKGKENELNIAYFTNGKPLSRTYQYYEGEYKNKETFKFHRIETMENTLPNGTGSTTTWLMQNAGMPKATSNQSII